MENIFDLVSTFILAFSGVIGAIGAVFLAKYIDNKRLKTAYLSKFYYRIFKPLNESIDLIDQLIESKTKSKQDYYNKFSDAKYAVTKDEVKYFIDEYYCLLAQSKCYPILKLLNDIMDRNLYVEKFDLSNNDGLSEDEYNKLTELRDLFSNDMVIINNLKLFYHKKQKLILKVK
jgi:hypothetical protein